MARAKSMGTATTLNLQGRNVLLTGGSRGLGYAILKELGANGANVLFCSRAEEQLLAAFKELKAFFPSPQRVTAEVCDISKEKDVAQLFDRLAAEFNAL